MNMDVNAVGGYQTGKAFFPGKKETGKTKVPSAEKQIKESSIMTQVAKSNVSAANEAKLSEKAQKFLARLREQYGDYDFMIGNGSDDLKELSKSGSKEFSVIFSSEEIEKMASDEKYAEEKMQGVEGAVKMSRRIAEENGFGSAYAGEDNANGVVNKIGIILGDDGSLKMFAELEKTTLKQKERIEKAKENKAEDKADKLKKNPYDKKDKDSVKRTTIEAGSEEELLAKIQNVDWKQIADSHSGDMFNFSV